MDFLNNITSLSLVLQEAYKYVHPALQRFDLSVDKSTLRNLRQWLGMQTVAKGIPVFTETLPFSNEIQQIYCKY